MDSEGIAMFETSVLQEDLEWICSAEYIPWELLRNKRVLVTGATGLIGYTFVNALIYANREKNLGLKITALVRDEDRARERFAEVRDDVEWLVGSVENMPAPDGPVDYVIHGASQTASRGFVQKPVETIQTALKGTSNLLELAKEKRTSGFVYLSSMEVYGYPQKGHKVTEDEMGALSPLEIRSSYPISKQQCESLCCAYAAEYGVPARIVRLTQTFGPGVNYNDGRVFAEFGRCVREKREIVLKTKGETERSYLYTADAATAILTVMLKGQPGTAYNAANEETYCSIAEMARRVAAIGGVQVKFDLQDEKKNGYLPPLYMDLDTSRLRALGWENIRGDIHILEEMYRRMIAFHENCFLLNNVSRR